MEEIIKKADVLIEALPYIRKFHRKVLIIKYGGSILGEDKIRLSVLEDIVFLNFMGLRPVLVHGGGPGITERLKRIGRKPEFIEGMRVTDARTLKIVHSELNKLNNQIVKELISLGADTVGLGQDAQIIRVKKKRIRPKLDMGFVGEITKINPKPINEALESGQIPVISPMARAKNSSIYNVNADEAAAFISKTLCAEKLVLLTNVAGIMRNPDDEDSLISTLTKNEARILIKQGVISQGMIPKIRSAVSSLKAGVKKAHIIDARLSHALLLEIFTDKGIGTEIIH